MIFRGLGLQGKFIIALLVAAALPFLIGLLSLETVGYRHLLAERGKLHHQQALTLVNALDQSSRNQSSRLRTWLAADSAVAALLDARRQQAAAKPANLPDEETRLLDEVWPALAADDPRVTDITGNPAARSLRAYQQLHPEVAEILLTDVRGRLVAATGKSTDVGQADESWWQQGSRAAPGEACTEDLRSDASAEVFSLDLVLPIHRDRELLGVIKLSEDVSTILERLHPGGGAGSERRRIVLADGRVLASTEPDFVSLEKSLQPPLLETLRHNRSGWTIANDENHEQRMIGFVTLENGQHQPAAYILFSSLRDDVVAPLQQLFLWLGVIGASLLTACTFIGYLLVSQNILQPLADLGEAARSISAAIGRDRPEADREKAEASLAKISDIHTGDEVEALAGDLAVLATRVLEHHREPEAPA